MEEASACSHANTDACIITQTRTHTNAHGGLGVTTHRLQPGCTMDPAMYKDQIVNPNLNPTGTYTTAHRISIYPVVGAKQKHKK